MTEGLREGVVVRRLLHTPGERRWAPEPGSCTGDGYRRFLDGLDLRFIKREPR